MPPIRGTGTADNPWPVSSSPPRAPQDLPSASSSAPRSVASTRPLRKIKIFDSPPSSNTLRINKGPPSTIPRDLARPTSDFAAAAHRAIGTICVLPPVPNDHERHAQAIERQRRRRREALDRRRADDARINRATAEYDVARRALAALGTNAPSTRSSSTRTRVRPNRAGTPLDPLGWRAPRDEELTRNDLLLNGVAPTPRETDRSHQRCGICLHVKSHPVSYICGHSHCYTCVRLWLEQRWVCPTCVTVMNRAPHRNYEEEAGIAMDFPDWVDQSVVDYNWDGLNFPKRQLIIAPDTDDEAQAGDH
ncbi:hypothetical protein B0H11DRAFT_1931049 [Mycena galericulata]|nr:hypothetical protein B0H11DRAFT_2264517 [Mycena galericulata]KAJ7444528.1 hypothetical protein B0H11DRAFT_1931049 [Mycena galericulata]